MKMRVLLLLITLLFLPVMANANVKVELRKGHPNRYTVQPGDTLWSVSARFLKHPWQWHLLWQDNPQITYPHDLYAGDVLELHLRDGKPILTLIPGGTVKLSPKARILPLKQPIPTIPIDAIRPFLNNSVVVDKNKFLQTPYVLIMVGEHETGGRGSEFYARSIFNKKFEVYSILRLGQAYIDPLSKKVLGYEGSYIGKARVIKNGDPAVLLIFAGDREALPGDRLVPATVGEYSKNFLPRAPNIPINGNIIAILGDATTQVGKLSSVVINRGRLDKVKVGDILDIYRHGNTIVDRFVTPEHQKVTLPALLAGQLMIYRVFDHVSYGMVMDAMHEISLQDTVTNPDEGQLND